MNRHQVIIVGAGFGGLEAARRLAKAPVQVTLLDKSNHHLFQPLLYQVATAGLAAPAIAAPIRHILRNQDNLTVLLHEVYNVDAQARCLTTRNGNRFDYDSLVLASGASHSYFGNDQWAAPAPGLKTLDDAMEIRRRVLLAFEMAERQPDRARDWLRFAVIGGGPTGVEMAGTLAEIARHTLRQQFRRIDPTSAEILLVEAGTNILGSYPAALSDSARRQLESLGVRVMLGEPVSDIDHDGIVLGGQRIECKTVVWAAGVRASPPAGLEAVATDRAGRILVQPDLTVADCPGLYVIGDLASISCNGQPVPGVSPAAKQMGRCAAHNIVAALRGQAPRNFQYVDYGSMATIGRKRAIAKIGRLQMRGLIAWLAWLFVHLYFLIGFRNRFAVMIDWAVAYFTFSRAARIVWRDTPDRPSTEPTANTTERSS